MQIIKRYIKSLTPWTIFSYSSNTNDSGVKNEQAVITFYKENFIIDFNFTFKINLNI